MTTTNRFLDKLTVLLDEGRAPLCVGLDPNPEQLPARYPDLLDWNQAIIDSTQDLAACYKPNIAFYEALGRDGYDLLARTIATIPPEIPILLDAKRGDIGSTAAAYARACFDVWDVDAVTLNPYLGGDSIRPFTAYSDRYIFVLCHTSNPSAAEVQWTSQWGVPLYRRIATEAMRWGEGNVGLVVGATYPETLAEVRTVVSDAWFLAPGVGAQGGDAASALAQGARADGRGVLINASRGISLADDHHAAAQSLCQQMQLPQTAQTSALSHQLRALALKLHDLGCIRFGEFTLASGIQSPVYIDLRLLVGDPTVLAAAAQVYAGLMAGLETDRIAGVPYAALPIATTVSLETNLPLIYPRKELKSHGRGRTIEGEYRTGDRVTVIEDLVTSAGSLIRSIETMRAEGLTITDAVVLIDREQGGRENLVAADVRLHAAFTFSRLLDVLHEVGRVDAAEYADVKRYLAGL